MQAAIARCCPSRLQYGNQETRTPCRPITPRRLNSVGDGTSPVWRCGTSWYEHELPPHAPRVRFEGPRNNATAEGKWSRNSGPAGQSDRRLYGRRPSMGCDQHLVRERQQSDGVSKAVEFPSDCGKRRHGQAEDQEPHVMPSPGRIISHRHGAAAASHGNIGSGAE